MKQPSTQWRERIAPDEEAHLERVRALVARAQQAKSAKYGKGRFLHRKPLAALSGTLDVLPDLPAHARHGLFATPGSHRAVVRLSNGAFDVQSNKMPDIRGFALKVFDVAGAGAMGGTTDHQDFLTINQDRFSSADSREFVDFLEAAVNSPASGLLHLFKAHGLSGGWSRLRLLLSVVNRKFDGFATERFDTVVPVACGPYAVRVRLKPAGNPPPRDPKVDLAQDVADRLAKGAISFDVELQFFVDEATTPIEDASKPWPESETPIVTVARLTLPKQGGDGLKAEVEAMKFDPWGGLAAHRPLGEIMRVRKAAYFVSQQARGAA